LRSAGRERRDGEEDSSQQEQAAVADVAAVVPAAGVGGAVGVDEAADVDDGDAPADQADATGDGGPEEQAAAGERREARDLGAALLAKADPGGEAGEDEGEDAAEVEDLDIRELIGVEELGETAARKELPRHPAIEKREHGADEDEWMEDIAAAVERAEDAEERNGGCEE